MSRLLGQMASPTGIDRHIGLDWLRIGAFGLLILFHIGLYFAPGPWLVKWPDTISWIAYPVAAIAPWRLMVLFAVSGYASAAMLSRASGTAAFFRDRSLRLLIPLVFGTLLIVAPQDWVRMQVSGDYRGGLLWFWTHQELSFRFFHEAFLPNWEHLWFLAYLWAYTALLAAAWAWWPGFRDWLGKAADWLAQGSRLITVPLVAIILTRAAIHHAGLEEVQRYNDLEGDVHFLPAFLFGFMLAQHPALWTAMARTWRVALTGSLLCLVSIWLNVGADEARASSLQTLSALVAETAMAWLMLPVMFHAAARLLQRDHRWRAPIARAVFPFYIVHQTVIVLAGYALRDSGLSALAVCAVMLAATLLTGLIAYQAAARFGWIGWLLGVPPRSAASRTGITALSGTVLPRQG